MDPENGLPDLGPEENAARDFITDDIAHGVGLDVPDPLEKMREDSEKEGNDPAAPAGGEKPEGTQPAAADPALAQPAAGALDPNDRAPDTWKPAVAAKWAQVDPEVRAEVARREANIRDYVQQTAPAIDVAQRLGKITAPYDEAFRKYNIDPMQHLQGLLQGHYKLILGSPEEKMGMARALLRDAGIDPASLADPNGRPDPMINQFQEALRVRDEQIARLSGEIGQITTAARAERTEQLTTEVAAFAKDKPHFDRLTESMTQLIKSGAARTLADAYDLAELRDPFTRAERLQRDAATLSAQSAADTAARAAAARKASSVNVKSRGSGRAAPKDESIDDTLKETMAAINSRH